MLCWKRLQDQQRARSPGGLCMRACRGPDSNGAQDEAPAGWQYHFPLSAGSTAALEAAWQHTIAAQPAAARGVVRVMFGRSLQVRSPQHLHARRTLRSSWAARAAPLWLPCSSTKHTA